MDTDNNGENKMADEQEVQISVEASADQSPAQAENLGAENGDNLIEPVVAEKAKMPENIQESEQPDLQVPTLEVSNERADGNVATLSPTIDETMEKTDDVTEIKPDGKTETPNKTPENVDEAKDQIDEVTTEKVNEESTEFVHTEEAAKKDQHVNEEIAMNIEVNTEEPEKEQGPLMETTVQPLSRGGSPVPDEPVVTVDEMPDASRTPPPVLVEGEEIDDIALQIAHRLTPVMDDNASIASSIEVPVYNRAELIERYQQAVEERSSLQSLNSQLQHKLAEYFRKKKTDERQQEIEKNASDQEQRYIKYLANLDELQAEQTREQESYKEQIEELKDRCFEKQNRVNEAREEFMKHKYDVAKQALNSRSGRQIPIKDIEQYQIQEQKKDHEVMLVRLENIKLKNRLKKREMQLKAKEELAEGLHLIDFEQLKIENQTYNEKIEERNEELLKLRKKITTTVQVLTHLKEKLQFVQAENTEQRSILKIVDARVAQKRDVLTRTKQARDALRIDNVKLRQKCGLLGNEPLLRDYEDRKDELTREFSTILDTGRSCHVGPTLSDVIVLE